MYNKITKHTDKIINNFQHTYIHVYVSICICVCVCESANVMRFDFSQLRPKSQQTNGLKKSQTSWDSPTSSSAAAAVTTLDNPEERTPRALLTPRPTDQQGAYYKSLQSDPNRNRNAKKSIAKCIVCCSLCSWTNYTRVHTLVRTQPVGKVSPQ